MIIIFSIAEDHSTFEVMKWLHHLGEYDVVRVNYHDAENDDNLSLYIREGDFHIRLHDRDISLRDIRGVWYRKGKNWLCDQFCKVTIEGFTRFTHYLNQKTATEEHKLSEYLHWLIENSVPTLGSASRSGLNKLVTLSVAKSVGLRIPEFHITNSKATLERIQHTENALITKAMGDGLYLFEKKEQQTGFFSFTEQITADNIAPLSDKFPPSFLQKCIEKQYEVRVFFLDGKCYSMAILSQSDEQTRTDYRKYNHEKPNRFVPFLLPEEEEKKIKTLFEKLMLNTGSVDLMVDTKGDFYFLEVNPVGQFGMVSVPCNYFLEKEVALKLIENAKTAI